MASESNENVTCADESTENNNTASEENTEEKTFVTDAPPPLHSVALVGAMLACFASTLPSLESIDEVATLETFTNRIFPNLISLKLLAWIRFTIATFMILLQFHEIFIGPGWEQVTHYLPQSKLKQSPISMRGFRTMMPFTSWSWNVLAASFAVNAYIALKAAYENDPIINQWILRAGVLLFEIAGPMALLVGLVVRYAIWPQVLQSSGGDTTELKKIRTLLWHNFNVFVSLAELGMLGGLPVRFVDFSVAPLFGLAYVLFSWMQINQWTPNEGPQFLYFFFDTTVGQTTSIALLVLLVILMFFYAAFALADVGFHHLGGGPLVHALAVLCGCSLVCRFRD